MSSECCRCKLVTNVIWKAVPGSRICIREGPLAELGKCTRHDIVRSGMIQDRLQRVVAVATVCIQYLRDTMEIFGCELIRYNIIVLVWHSHLTKENYM